MNTSIDSSDTSRELAVVTGASSGIGLELARLCAKAGYDLVIAADQGAIETLATDLQGLGSTHVDAVRCDLATSDGVDQLMARIGERHVDAKHSLCPSGSLQ